MNPQNSFEIWRGDNINFAFTFQRNGAALTIPEGTKSRIIAKLIKAGGVVDPEEAPLFSGEFNTPTTASFSSDKTAGAAGNYLLTVILYTSGTSLITAQGVYFELKENGYMGTWTPGQDYRDEVLTAAQNAIDAAAAALNSKNAAASSASGAAADALVSEGWAKGTQNGEPVASGSPYYQANSKYYSEQAANSASSASDSASAALGSKNAAAASAAAAAQSASEFLTLERIGKFYAPVGGEKVSCNRANYNIQPTCSFVFTTDNMNASELFTMFGCVFGGHTSGSTALFTIMDDQWLDVVSLDNIPAAPIYCVAFVWTSDGKIKIAANDSSLAATSLSFSTSVTEFGFDSTYANGDSSFSRLAVFDFDILDANAPYTFADYRAGKSVPRALRSRYGYSTDPNMGASTSAWNITTPPGEYDGVKNGDWVAGSLVSYLKNRASDLPDGESYAIDLAMNGSGSIYEQAALSNSYGHFQADTSTRKYRVKFKYKWNKLASASDNVFFGVYIWGPEISQQQLVKINAPTAPDTSWHEYDAVITDSIEDGLYIPALFVSPTSSPTYGDYAISVAGFSITTADDVLCEADDALSGPQIHDLSGNGNHLNFHEGYVEVGRGVSADKNRNPASACYDNFSLDLSKNTGARIGGSTVVAAAGKCVCTLKLWSDKALTLRVSVSGYTSSVTFSTARTWQSVNCWGGGDYNIPISIFRNAAGTGIVNLKAAITYDELIM